MSDTADRAKWKMKICQHHKQHGYCHFGKNCAFAHGEKDKQLYKNDLCEFDQFGHHGCQLGKDCGFAHGESDLRRKCKFHFEHKDGCVQGKTCQFLHEQGDAKQGGKWNADTGDAAPRDGTKTFSRTPEPHSLSLPNFEEQRDPLLFYLRGAGQQQQQQQQQYHQKTQQQHCHQDFISAAASKPTLQTRGAALQEQEPGWELATTRSMKCPGNTDTG